MGVVGPLFTEEAGDSLFESSSLPSFRDLELFFFFLRFDPPLCFDSFLVSLDSWSTFEELSFVIIVAGIASFASSSSLSSSDESSELDDDDDDDDDSEDEDDDEELEFDELDVESDDPE